MYPCDQLILKMTFYVINLLFSGLIMGATAVAPIDKIKNDGACEDNAMECEECHFLVILLQGVLHLIGEPDFRDVSLRWQYEPAAGAAGEEGDAPALYGFQVHYCEMQAWGPHRCRTKVVDNVEESATQARRRHGRSGRSYSARIGGLRMATTYSFEVRPIERSARDLDDAESIGKSIIVPTKGFSARATQCLPDASELEVSTGPHFGGRIAVEAAGGGPERGGCGVRGDPASAQDAYTLRIRHDQCGSDVNGTTVATYVLVQETLPILTHSTRRFLVLCTFQPETLTVRAGINLPKSPGGDALRPGSAEPRADVDYNELQPARLEAAPDDAADGMFGEIALVVFLVMASFAGIGLLVWKMLPREADDASVSTAYSSRSGLFGRLARQNIDRFSDAGSIYSITLSERDECQFRTPNADSDNTSEA